MNKRRLGGLHWPGWLLLVGKRPCGYMPYFATLNTQGTHHRARRGPTLATRTGGSPACPAAESARKDPRPQEKKLCIPETKNRIPGKYSVVLYPWNNTISWTCDILSSSVSPSYRPRFQSNSYLKKYTLHVPGIRLDHWD